MYKKGINASFLRKFVNLMNEKDARIALSVGGGSIAREYVDKAKLFGANNFEMDEIAIKLVQANSKLVASAIDDAFYAANYNEANVLFNDGKTVVLGIANPGQTTDAVSALFAEQVGADRWVNLTNVDGVYDRDPRKFKSAKKYKTMTHKQLLKLTENKDERKPRENFIVDLVAMKILARSNIEAHFVNGEDFNEVRKAILGKPHNGTVVKD